MDTLGSNNNNNTTTTSNNNNNNNNNNNQQQPTIVCQVREEVSQQVEAARQELVAENRVRSLGKWPMLTRVHHQHLVT